ncbi:hypothetical protein ABZ896_42655 [Streptomyces sp. NPDC047072]|uniref:hypothetical protein n=1 Tax=Streptomyces sp. NPDC047072 TaxID=3154809 RepID=UPI0033C3389E
MGAHTPQLQLDLWQDPPPATAHAKPTTVLSYGLGADSTLVLIEMLRDPTGYGLEPDLSDLIVITATVGSEWADTVRLVEDHIFPLLRRHRVRYIQVARCGPYEADGWEVLADSREPRRFVPRGRWTLMDELSLNGTVVQASGGNSCSLKYKGWPLDQWGLAAFPGRPFRKIVGYHAGEHKRARSYDGCQHEDNLKARRTICTVEYPLIGRAWDRDIVEARLFTEFGFVWPKSYCTFCVYSGSCAALPVHLARLRDHLEQAVEVLALEYTSMALNENGSFYPKGTLYELVAGDGNTAALRALDGHLTSAEWALYRVRRVFPPARTKSCRERHGDSCPSPWPGCLDPDTGERTPPCMQWHGPACRNPQPSCRDASRKGKASRSVEVVITGTHAQVADLIHRRAQEGGERVEESHLHPLGHLRSQTLSRGTRFPTVEEFHAIAPSGVIAKQKKNFEELWHTTCRQLRLPI